MASLRLTDVTCLRTFSARLSFTISSLTFARGLPTTIGARSGGYLDTKGVSERCSCEAAKLGVKLPAMAPSGRSQSQIMQLHHQSLDIFSTRTLATAWKNSLARNTLVTQRWTMAWMAIGC